MGKPKNGSKITNPDHLKQLHSNADSKYRSKNQFLYNKLRDTIQSEGTKDKLLLDTLEFIQKTEKEIQNKIGLPGVEQLKEGFRMFLHSEEAIWKKSDDVEDWWSKVEMRLNEGKIDSENNENEGSKSNSSTKSTKKKCEKTPNMVEETSTPEDDSTSLSSFLYIAEMDEDTFNTTSSGGIYFKRILNSEFESMYLGKQLTDLTNEDTSFYAD